MTWCGSFGLLHDNQANGFSGRASTVPGLGTKPRPERYLLPSGNCASKSAESSVVILVMEGSGDAAFAAIPPLSAMPIDTDATAPIDTNFCKRYFPVLGAGDYARA